jgi:hypothetical protein
MRRHGDLRAFNYIKRGITRGAAATFRKSLAKPGNVPAREQTGGFTLVQRSSNVDDVT